MNRKKIGETAPQAMPNPKHIASNDPSMPLNGQGGYFVNPLQNPTSTGAGYNLNTVAHAGNLNTMPVTPTSQSGPAVAGNHHPNTPNFPTTSGYNMQPYAQFNPNSQNHPIVQHYPVFHNLNVGAMGAVSTTTPPPGEFPNNNTAPRMQQRHQMFGHPHPGPVANQTWQPVDYSTVTQATMAQATVAQATMAQTVQPAQPVAPQKTVEEETTKAYKELYDEEEYIEDPVKGLDNLARWEEAEKRANLKLTPKLAKDVPKTKAKEMELAGGLTNVMWAWRTRDPRGFSETAIKRIKAKKAVSFHITAYKLLVCKSQDLEGIHTG